MVGLDKGLKGTLDTPARQRDLPLLILRSERVIRLTSPVKGFSVNAQSRIGPECGQQLRRSRICEPPEFSGAFRQTKSGLSFILLRINIGTLLHEILEQLVQTTEGRTVQRRKVCLVRRIDVSTGGEQEFDACLCKRCFWASRHLCRGAWAFSVTESSRRHKRRRLGSRRWVHICARGQQRSYDIG